MNFEEIALLTENLRKKVIGDPDWITSKQVFEYSKIDARTVSILKAIRVIQGLKSLRLLCNEGLLVDMCALWRCIYDAIAEIYFVLEKYPELGQNAEKFILDFAKTTIEGDLSNKEGVVLSRKIHSAMARVLNKNDPHNTSKTIKKIYRTFSGYTHANYSHVMQSYEGFEGSLSYNLAGVPSVNQKEQHMQLVNEITKSALGALHFIAITFNCTDLGNQIKYQYSQVP